MNITSEMDFLTTRPDATNQTPDGTSDKSSDWIVHDIENSVVVRVIYGIIALVGFIGNFLVCFTLLKLPALRSRTSFFIIHLAITDIVILILVIPLYIFPYTAKFPQQPGYDALCRVFFSRYPFWSTTGTSAYSLLFVTAERFTAVVFPIKYKTVFTKRNSGIMTAACWFIGMISMAFFFQTCWLEDGRCSCGQYPSKGYQGFIGFTTMTIFYVFPIGFMIYAHYRMIRELRVRERLLHEGQSGADRNSQSGENDREAWQLEAVKQLIHTLLWVVITYAICLAPNQILIFAFNMGAPVDFSKLYYHLSVIFVIGNSCMNPIIYSWKNKAYRSGIKEALNWKSNRVNVQNEGMNVRANGPCKVLATHTEYQTQETFKIAL